jgi:hypothetical protein
MALPRVDLIASSSRGLDRHVLWVGLLMGLISLVLSTLVFWGVELEKRLMRGADE